MNLQENRRRSPNFRQIQLQQSCRFLLPVKHFGIFHGRLFREPGRRKFSAVFLAGAGAAYLSGGLGIAEFAFCALITFLAYRGLDNYRYIAIGWVLHTCWDLAHHYHGNPIIIFDPTSSIGCAICDLGLAAYYAIGAPSIVRNAAIQKQA
jgi:Family of unknown function (DUF6010)